jgi:hypothetical protein
VTVLGDLLGGSGVNNGQIFAGGSIGLVTIAGQVNLNTNAPGAGANSARIRADDNIGKVKIGLGVRGDDGANSGSIQALTGSIGSVKIGGDLEGGAGTRSGHIAAGTTVGKVKIGGSVFAGTGFLSGVIAADDSIGEVTIGADIVGVDEDHLAGIVVKGLDNPTGLAIGKVTVLDEMNFAFILAGYNPGNFLPADADAAIGKVKIGTNFTASLIAAGVDPKGDARFATADDTVFDEPPAGAAGDEPPLARIDKVVIGGGAFGTGAAGDHFGIVAQEIGVVKIAGVPLVLNAGSDNDVIELLPGGTNDVTLREV